MKGNPSLSSSVPGLAELDADLGDRYRVVELIGEGGMGAVFRASQPALQRDVAIKILPSEIDSNSFVEESQILARCNHPNIVSVFEYGTTSSGIPYIVMEHVDGITLDEWIEERQPTPQELFPVLRQICNGLAYAHTRGMVHLDIKPANILINRENQIKLVDFGVARMTGDLSGKPRGGTPAFAAPELISGSKEIDPRSDIYSLGVVLYWILTREMPRGLRRSPSTIDPLIDPGFDRITEFALKKDPSSRYQSVSEFEADLMDLYFSLPPSSADHEKPGGLSLVKRLVIVFLSMFVSQIVGSAFNIWYNSHYIIPAFFPANPDRFQGAINTYNIGAYLPLTCLWGYLVFSLRRVPLSKARRRVINLPWWALGIASVGWIGCIPGLWLPLKGEGSELFFQLAVSVTIGAAMAVTQGFLVVDLLAQKLLYRDFFGRDEAPWKTKGAIPLSLTGRGVFWTFSAGVCPVVALLLLSSDENRLFAGWVSVFCIVFGIAGAWLLARLVVDPINELRDAARAIGQGDLEHRVHCQRADELGLLGGQFNQMVTGLREREYIRNRFGSSHSNDTIDEILQRPSEATGTEKELVAMTVFLDGHRAILDRPDADSTLDLVARVENLFRTEAERRGGLPQDARFPFLTAFFGIDGNRRRALAYAEATATALEEDLRIILESTGVVPRIAIESGKAIVGTIQSGRSREIRVLGDLSEQVRLAAMAKGE